MPDQDTSSKKHLEAERRQLLKRLRELDTEISSTTTDAPARSKPGRSVRDLVLDALDDIGFMTFTAQLALYIKARFGREIPAARFGTLAADEKVTFLRQGPRAVWLGHGLTYDRAEPVKRLWARSDWDLHKRVVTPSFGRAQYLRAAARFAELAMRDGFAADSELLRYLAADHARDLGVAFKRGKFDLAGWKNTAEAQLAEIEPKENESINAALEQLGALDPVEQLFGRTAPALYLTPATREKQA